MELAGVVRSSAIASSNPCSGDASRRSSEAARSRATASCEPNTSCSSPTTWLGEAGGFPEAFETATTRWSRRAASRRRTGFDLRGGRRRGRRRRTDRPRPRCRGDAVTRTDEHHGRLRALGADETRDRRGGSASRPWTSSSNSWAPRTWSLAQRRLIRFARVVVIGVGAGPRLEIELSEAHGDPRVDHGLDHARAHARGEGRGGPRGRGGTSSRAGRRANSVPSPGPSRSRTPRRPTRFSPSPGSWARCLLTATWSALGWSRCRRRAPPSRCDPRARTTTPSSRLTSARSRGVNHLPDPARAWRA